MSNMNRYYIFHRTPSERNRVTLWILSKVVQSGIYSCAVDCFLEVSGYLFWRELSKLTKRSEFPKLLFTAASNYRNQGGNSSCLPAIQQPVCLYLREWTVHFKQGILIPLLAKFFRRRLLEIFVQKKSIFFAKRCNSLSKSSIFLCLQQERFSLIKEP